MIGMREGLKRWWRRRQLVNLLMEQLEEGHGVISRAWPPGTSTETVLAWCDDQIAATRTPYGLSGLKVAILGEVGPPLYEVLLKGRTEWQSDRRDSFRAAVAPLLVERGITTAIISFGTALHDLLEPPGS